MLRTTQNDSVSVPRRPSLVVLLCLCLTTYFAYHTMQGRHGLAARFKLIERSTTVEQEIRAHEAVRSRLERETVLLGDEQPDPDYIDDLARQMLGFAHPSDRLILVRPAAGKRHP